MKNLKNMDVKLSYVKDFELDDYFISALENLPSTLSLTIALYIEEHLPELEVNRLCSHVRAGLVYHYGEAIPFIIEITKSEENFIVLSDLQFIDMDEYLDFINLKLNLNVDERFSYPKLIIRSQ